VTVFPGSARVISTTGNSGAYLLLKFRPPAIRVTPVADWSAPAPRRTRVRNCLAASFSLSFGASDTASGSIAKMRVQTIGVFYDFHGMPYS
jgi:hypothetical protein